LFSHRRKDTDDTTIDNSIFVVVRSVVNNVHELFRPSPEFLRAGLPPSSTAGVQ
jgi:hypothetical protein